jgi:hypothetical protein
VQVSEKCDRDPGNDKRKKKEIKYELYTESPNSPRLKNVRWMKSKVNHILMFFDIKGIVHKEVFLAGQTVSSAYYCDILL